MSPSHASANARTEERSARSSVRTSVSPGIEAAASRPRRSSRTASTTRAPARPSSRAAASPMPLLAPVTTTVRPACEGRSLGVHFDVVMGNNVAADNTVVNVYIDRYPVRVAVTPRPYHHGNLRAALLAQAERTLADGGDLSLRELARQIGVSHAAPRRHFAGKQALLDALAEDGFERLGAELRGGARRRPTASTPASSPSRARTSTSPPSTPPCSS